MIANLTNPYIKSLHPKNKIYKVWDAVTKGFGVAVYPKGKKSFLAQARVNGKLKSHTIGTVGQIPLKQARGLAEMALMDMRDGTDFVAQMGINKIKAENPETEWTIAELFEKFIKEYALVHCKPRTAEEYRRTLEIHLLPKFGHFKINDLTVKDMRAMHGRLSNKPHAANKILKSTSKMYNQAKIWELCDKLENPCQGIRKYPETIRVSYLNDDEKECLHLALNDEEPAAPMAVAAFRLLLYTGARRGEIQSMKWEYISGSQANLPDSKTGRKAIYLSPEAKEVLSGIPSVDGNEYVIVGKMPGTYLVNLKTPWKRVRQRATVYYFRHYSNDQMGQLVDDLESSLGHLPSYSECRREAGKRGIEIPEGLTEFRIHDLRHNYASQLVMSGEDIAIVKEVLGHRRIETTQRYAHFDTSSVQKAVDRNCTAFTARGVTSDIPNDCKTKERQRSS